MKVLLPVDGSEAAHATLIWTTQFLNPECAELYLVQVVPWSVDALVHESEIEAAEQTLKQETEFLRNRGFHVAEAQYLLGAPSQKICDFADTIDANQIIIGSHGKGRLKRLLMGSVSQGVFQCAHQPVLLFNNIDEPMLEVSHPEQAMLRQDDDQIRKVLIPVDASAGSRRTLQWAAQFLDNRTSEVHLLHVYSHSPEGGYRYPEFSESETALVAAETLMKEYGFQVITICTVGAADTETCRYANEHGMDEIIIGSHGDRGIDKLFMGSTTQGILKCAKQPVMVLNNTDKPSLKVSKPDQSGLSPGQC